MDYAIFGVESDVFVSDATGDGLVCNACRLQNGSPFGAASPQIMLDHLLNHRSQKHAHLVPDEVFSSIQEKMNRVVKAAAPIGTTSDVIPWEGK